MYASRHSRADNGIVLQAWQEPQAAKALRAAQELRVAREPRVAQEPKAVLGPQASQVRPESMKSYCRCQTLAWYALCRRPITSARCTSQLRPRLGQRCGVAAHIAQPTSFWARRYSWSHRPDRTHRPHRGVLVTLHAVFLCINGRGT